MSYHICSLYSGSGGNCVLIQAGGAKVLVDAGKSCRTLCAALEAQGHGIGEIDAIFITHEHTDHVGALEQLSKRYSIPVHITEASLGGMPAGVYLRQAAVTHPPLYSVQVAGLTVSSFTTSHDSACAVGYRFEFEDESGTHCLGLATDTGYVTEGMETGLSGCEAVVLECNHDPNMLMTGHYPYQLKLRIRSRQGHLSNEDCAALAARLVARGTQHILLAHLSRDNNHPAVALSAVREAVPQEAVDIKIADPSEAVVLM